MLVGTMVAKDEKYFGYAIASVINTVDKMLVGMGGDLSLESPVIKFYKEQCPDKFFVYPEKSEDETVAKNTLFAAVNQCASGKGWTGIKWVLYLKDTHIFYNGIHLAPRILRLAETPNIMKFSKGGLGTIGIVRARQWFMFKDNYYIPLHINKNKFVCSFPSFYRWSPNLKWEGGKVVTPFKGLTIAASVDFADLKAIDVKAKSDKVEKYDLRLPTVIWQYKTGNSKEDFDWLKYYIESDKKRHIER